MFRSLDKRALTVGILLVATFAAAQELEVATQLAITEGPTVDREGNVYFTEIMTQRIMKFGKDGVLSVYREHSNAASARTSRAFPAEACL